METQRVRLDGWKEISNGIGVSERTARRYEVQECLPVHRHIHQERASVYAWSDELKSWKQSRSGAWAICAQDRVIQPEQRAPLNLPPAQAAESLPAVGRDVGERDVVGRDRELHCILRAIDDALSRRGSVVLIGGEPGIGKTHLAKVILAEAAQNGCLGLTGHCRDMEGAPPYVPVVEMLEECGRVLPRGVFRNCLGDSAAEISRLMPGLRQLFPDIPATVDAPADQQRRILFCACRDFVERLAQLQPLVVLFEDLHWADEATLLLFSHLAESASRLPLLLVATWRDAPRDISRPLARLLESCHRDKAAQCLNLRAFELPEVAALLDRLSGQTPPQELCRLVFEQTEGNPFFVEELFLHLRSRGELFDEHGSWRKTFPNDLVNVPHGIRLLIERRLEKLGEPTQRLLKLASILGRSFPIRVLEELETTDAGKVVDALEEAERAQLIEVDGQERELKYRFVHELIRQTLHESLSAPRRRRLHADVASALQRLYAGKPELQVSTLAHHLYEAGANVDAGRTIACLLSAARTASGTAAHEEAISCVEKALLLAKSEGAPDIAGLIAMKATALRGLSRTNEAIDTYEEAIGLFIEAGKYAEAAEASQALGHIHLWRADPARACGVLDRAVRACDMTAPAARYPLELLNAVSLGVKGDMAAAFAALEKAKRTEADLADSSPELIGYARMSEAHLCYFSAQAGAAAECARAAVNAFRATGNVWAELETYEVASTALWDGAAATENDAVLSNLLRRAEQIGHRNAVWTYRFMQAELLMHRGELQQAEVAAKQVHDYASAISAPWAFIDYVLLAAIAHYRGDLAGGAQWSRIALDLEPECYMSGLSSGSLYWNLAAQGDSGAESALALARRNLPAAGQVLTLGSSSCLAYVVEGLATEGRIQEAAALEPAADWAVANGPPWLYSRHVLATCAGIAAASAHNWAHAEEYHRIAIQTADSRGCRVAQPVSRYWYADMLRSRELPGDRERARDLLYESRSLAESMSMAWHARNAATRLASM